MSRPRTRAGKKRGLTFRVVLIGLLGLTALAIGIFAVLYFRFVHYDRVAAKHVPPGALFAGRVDLEQVILFEPVRRHVLRAINQGTAAPAGASDSEASRLGRLKQLTGIDVARDLREILVAYGPRKDDWTLVLGGKFVSVGLVPRIAAWLRSEGFSSCQLSGETLNCWGERLSVKQAPDGALVAASNRSVLEQAVMPSDGYQQLGLSLSGPGSFVVRGPAFWHVGSHPLALVTPGLQLFSKVEQFSGELQLGSETTIEVALTPRTGQSAETLRPQVDALLGGLRALLALVPGGELAGERSMLSRAKLIARDSEDLVVQTDWQRDEIDRGARSLAQWLESWLKQAPK